MARRTSLGNVPATTSIEDAVRAQQLRYAVHALERLTSGVPSPDVHAAMAMKHILGPHAYAAAHPDQAPTVEDVRALVVRLACALDLLAPGQALSSEDLPRLKQAGRRR